MLKVLIVDDSALFRTELKTMIDWERHGFYISGEAGHGASAIELLKQDDPDIVITDMDMPVMNGTALIDHIEKHFPHIRVIALSAFDHFDYVRHSMKKGAIDYVLKHRLNAEALLESLEAARESLLKYKSEREKQNAMRMEMLKEREAMRQKIVFQLLEGSLSETETGESTMTSLDIPLDSRNLMVAVIEIDDFSFIEEKYNSKEQDVLLKTFMDISKEILAGWEKSFFLQLSKGRFAVIFSLDNAGMLSVYQRLYTVLNRIRLETAKFLNITASIGVSGVCDELRNLHNAYREAVSRLNEKFYKGKNSIFIEYTPVRYEESFFFLDIRDEKAIYAALAQLDFNCAESRIKEIFSKLSDLKVSKKSIQMICAELMNIIHKIAKEAGIEISQLYQREDMPYLLIQKYETLKEIEEWILSLAHKLVSLLERLRIENNQLSGITRKAVEYIHRNYGKDISLTDVAQYTGVSGSYISRLFKKECRMGFAEYLNRVRVEQAKWHIEHGELKLKEIVCRVGFNNYNYFFKVFKEVAGMTPLEYEQFCRKA